MGKASRAKRERRADRPEPWQPLHRASRVWNRATGEEVELADDSEWWFNDTYNVHKYVSDGGRAVHLAITRKDQRAVRNWRHFQAIKDELIGVDCEAVELYPAHDRLVDAANTFHLWGVADPSFRFPLGFKDRLVMTPEEAAAFTPGAVQAPTDRTETDDERRARELTNEFFQRTLRPDDAR